jgi:hypothetical protein
MPRDLSALQEAHVEGVRVRRELRLNGRQAPHGGHVRVVASHGTPVLAPDSNSASMRDSACCSDWSLFVVRAGARSWKRLDFSRSGRGDERAK